MLDFESPDALQFGLAMIEMYIPLWITIILTIIIIRKIIIFLRSSVSVEAANIASRLKYYPLAMLTIWLFPTLRIIICLILKQNISWMDDVSEVFLCSQGLLYSLIFYKSESVQFRSRSRSNRTDSIISSAPSNKTRGSTVDLTLETMKHLETNE